jgi:hypothetical protein
MTLFKSYLIKLNISLHLHKFRASNSDSDLFGQKILLNFRFFKYWWQGRTTAAAAGCFEFKGAGN